MHCSRRHLLQLAAGGAGLWLARPLLGRSGSAASLTPEAEADARALRIALISDLNSSYGSTSYVPQVQRGVALLGRLRPDLVLCAGDMVAGQKRGLTATQLQAMWRSFGLNVLDPLLADGVSFAAAMGNHDASSSQQNGRYVFGLDRQEARRFWIAQRSRLGITLLEASAFPFHYTLLHRGVFVLVLDASSAGLGAEQLRWAERQLASPQARQARLRLAIGHLPLYAVGQGRDRSGEVLHQPAVLQALLERQGVALYISGHHHTWFPGRVGGLNLLSLGAMGSGPRRLLQSTVPPQQTLTLLELSSGVGELSETTYSLNSLEPLAAGSLPQAIQPSQGPRLQRRPLQMALS